MIDTFWQFILNNMMLSALWVAAILAIIAFELYLKVFGPKKVSITELSQIVNNNEGLVIDLRDKSAFDDGHIPNAENIPANKLNEIVKQDNYSKRPLILVCNSGQSAFSKALKIQKSGIKNINVLKGGMISWNSDNMPLVKN